MLYLQAIRNGHIAAICLKVNYFSGIYIDERPQVAPLAGYRRAAPKLERRKNLATGDERCAPGNALSRMKKSRHPHLRLGGVEGPPSSEPHIPFLEKY
jgi:hypothetical protein